MTPEIQQLLVDAEERDAGSIRRRADAATLIATNLAGGADGTPTGNTAGIRFTELLGARPSKRRANPAAFIAAELIGSARVAAALLARRGSTELASAPLSQRDTATTALVAAVFPRSAHHLVALLELAEFF